MYWEFHKDRFRAHYFLFLFFSIYINDLPLSIQNSEIDMYADDTTIWSSGNMCESIQRSLQESLNNADCWFSLNGMKPNAKKITDKYYWNCSKASLHRQDNMNLFLNDAKLEEAIGENLLGIRIDNNLTCNSHIDYIIIKLNSTINLLNCCCTVWGNFSKEQLNILLRLQKRWARMILDANFIIIIITGIDSPNELQLACNGCYNCGKIKNICQPLQFTAKRCTMKSGSD